MSGVFSGFKQTFLSDILGRGNKQVKHEKIPLKTIPSDHIPTLDYWVDTLRYHSSEQYVYQATTVLIFFINYYIKHGFDEVELQKKYRYAKIGIPYIDRRKME